ncbi:hypothetical protein DSO57_1005543 [Entomophthora muscae]|uniref:Uncharacterized protein n=1 Tax=Entomophthora muscae TaxID=34485 RepID=A0ACC2TJ58_9FUNG|nr:hypothetical protein DSO57_1005543 [Entomophthora muscae]
MTLPLTSQPNRPMEPPTAAKTTSTQLFGWKGRLYCAQLRRRSLLGQYVSYIIMLAPVLWWALSSGPVVPYPESPNASIYSYLPDNNPHTLNNWLSGVITKRGPQGMDPFWKRFLTVYKEYWGLRSFWPEA